MTQEVFAGTRKEWREWFRKNHKKESKVTLVSYKKHTGKPALTHRESMEEAICWGWIDTTVKRRDEDTYERRFAKRTKNSRWSNNTQRYAQEQIKKRRMTSYGLKMYELGLQKPVLDLDLPKNPDPPEDLKKALGEHLNLFEKRALSFKRYNIYWIEKAKRPETRNKRIAEVAKLCLPKK